MKRQIIRIDRDKCNGCGRCADACHEGAIGIVNGKAKLLREDHCDGLGNCLPECPAGAISLVTRDAQAFSPGPDIPVMNNRGRADDTGPVNKAGRKWPIQLKLVPSKAPFFDGADLLIASDCTAFVCKDFYERFAKDRTVLIACPKLDREEYSARIAAILDKNDVRSVTLVRMEVPCCAEMTRMVREGIRMSNKDIPLNTVILSTDGDTVG